MEQFHHDERYREVHTMIHPPFGHYWLEKGRDEGLEKGRDEGLEKGRDEGQRQLLQVQLEQRFGPLSPAVRERLQSCSGEKLIQLGKAFVQAQSLRELGLED